MWKVCLGKLGADQGLAGGSWRLKIPVIELCLMDLFSDFLSNVGLYRYSCHHVTILDFMVTS